MKTISTHEIDLIKWAEANNLLKEFENMQDPMKREDVIELLYRMLKGSIYDKSTVHSTIKHTVRNGSGDILAEY